MKKIYTASDLLLVGHLRAVLESEGIATLLKNEHLSGGIGELPAIECWPELWVVDDADAPAAEHLLGGLIAAAPLSNNASSDASGSAAGDTWRCPNCGEMLEAQFTDCWRCMGGSLLA